MVNSVSAEPWPSFTDHIVTASVSFQLETEKVAEETHLLESGKRLKRHNFNKAPWPEIQKQLSVIDWEPMKDQAKLGPVAALSWFMNQIIPLLESLVPLRNSTKQGSKLEKSRKLLWRKLGKVQRQTETVCSASRLSKLFKEKWSLEKKLKEGYISVNEKEEENAIVNLKENPKSFFSFANSGQ